MVMQVRRSVGSSHKLKRAAQETDQQRLFYNYWDGRLITSTLCNFQIIQGTANGKGTNSLGMISECYTKVSKRIISINIGVYSRDMFPATNH